MTVDQRLAHFMGSVEELLGQIPVRDDPNRLTSQMTGQLGAAQLLRGSARGFVLLLAAWATTLIIDRLSPWSLELAASMVWGIGSTTGLGFLSIGLIRLAVDRIPFPAMTRFALAHQHWARASGQRAIVIALLATIVVIFHSGSPVQMVIVALMSSLAVIGLAGSLPLEPYLPRSEDGLDPWAVLGIDYDADDQQVKRAFRSLSLRHHPDHDPSAGADDRFRQIKAAYEAISDARY